MSACASPLHRGWQAYEAGAYAEARTAWEPLAASGDATAQFYLGLLLDNGQGAPEDDVAAAEWYRKAAEQGHAPAQNNLGLLHYQGHGVERSTGEAARWYGLAAEQGFAPALGNLGLMHLLGQTEHADLREGRALLREAAAQNVTRAATALALWQPDGGGLEEATATRLLMNAAARGVVEAEYAVGWLYYEGVSLPRDPLAAASWFERAALQGHAAAQLNLGVMLLRGEGCEPDAARGREWLRRAAEQGVPAAQRALESSAAMPPGNRTGQERAFAKRST